jgi:hypothetical protein
VVIDQRDDWSEHQPSTKAENEFIEAHGWEEYANWHLGLALARRLGDRCGGDLGLAFGLSALGIVAVAAAVFAALFPRVMASTGAGPALTISSAASAHQTLLVMTVVAAIFVRWCWSTRAGASGCSGSGWSGPRLGPGRH